MVRKPTRELQGAAGAMVPVVVALVRVYLGWAYVGDRLLSAVVEYEETGWCAAQLLSLNSPAPPSVQCGPVLFSPLVSLALRRRYDGQTWVKPPKVLARDRLLGSYEARRRSASRQFAKCFLMLEGA